MTDVCIQVYATVPSNLHFFFISELYPSCLEKVHDQLTLWKLEDDVEQVQVVPTHKSGL